MSEAFDRVWGLVKFRIPVVGPGSEPDAGWYRGSVQAPFNHPGVGHPPRYNHHPSFNEQDLDPHTDYHNQRAHGLANWKGDSRIMLRPLIADALGVPDDYEMKLPKLTDEEIERIINRVQEVGHHEAMHTAQHMVYPYENIHISDNYDDKFPDQVTVSPYEHEMMQEIGAALGPSSMADERRKASIRDKAFHPAFSPDRHALDAIRTNIFHDRWREAAEMTEEEVANEMGLRARANAMKLGGDKHGRV